MQRWLVSACLRSSSLCRAGTRRQKASIFLWSVIQVSYTREFCRALVLSDALQKGTWSNCRYQEVKRGHGRGSRVEQDRGAMTREMGKIEISVGEGGGQKGKGIEAEHQRKTRKAEKINLTCWLVLSQLDTSEITGETGVSCLHKMERKCLHKMANLWGIFLIRD